MDSIKFTGKDLRAIGFPEGKAIGTALRILATAYKGKDKQQLLKLLARVVVHPESYEQHNTLGEIAQDLLSQTEDQTIALHQERLPYQVYGGEGIAESAIEQMDVAMKLPVTTAGALMPDAHPGYGLPIGGVLAVENAVIPYGVGVDIGCRMCLTIYDLPVSMLDQKTAQLKKVLTDHTRFGIATFNQVPDDPIMERDAFREINIVKNLKDRAYKQLGSSGGGNHFVEFGLVTLSKDQPAIGLHSGTYLGLLSHSGSRGLGAAIAQHYTKLAKSLCSLPDTAKHLAWLNLDTEAGQEYWSAMNLAGDYASACHDHIHQRIAAALGEQYMAKIENHHNFAWKEKDADGKEIIVHRKGATPAGKDVLGIIPGSMTSPGFIVKGKGVSASINSASHGAGRVLSRRKAKEQLSAKEVKTHIEQAGITLIGSGLDEAPMVYKDIHQVMAYQQDLVEVLGTFMPKVVRMCGDEKFQEVD